MPAHLYRPRHDPPTIRDRVLIHSSDAGLAGLLTTPVAVLVLITPLLPGYEPSNTLERLPAILSLAMAVMLGAGGVLATLGLFWRGHVVSTGWTLEQIGWWFVAGGWGGFAYMAFVKSPFTTISWYIPAVLSLLALTRAVVVFLIERDTRPRAEEIKHERECGGPT